MDIQNILDQMNLVVLNISLWQGRKALQAEDLAANGIDVTKLPPGTLATLGSKRIISPDALKVFSAQKREAMTLCLKNGVRFAGDGYAIPRDKSQLVIKELKRLKEEFLTAKNCFLAVYEEEVEKWIASNPPEWTPVIRSAVDSSYHINKAISFNYAALDVKAPDEIGENGLDDEVSSLYGQLCHEVRFAATRAYEYSFVGKQEVTQKALRPIRTIRAKLEGLAFLDPSIGETIKTIDDTLSKLPKGAIKGTDLNMVAGLLSRQLANMGRTDEDDPELPDDDINESVEKAFTAEIPMPQDTGRVAPITWDF